jgi:crotonobetainyl-CoA:carnitine CoA-transferase CaiB-like acyl-CoA transferase
MSALEGLTVIDLSTLFAGPMAAMHLGDMGATVIKVENTTRPDPARGHGPSKDGQNLWWKTLGRNKRTICTRTADARRCCAWWRRRMS